MIRGTLTIVVSTLTIGTAIVATTAPASAIFGLGWIENAANEQLALAACTRRLYPGLTGEALHKAQERVRTDFAVASALFGIKTIHEYCASEHALRRRIERAVEERQLENRPRERAEQARQPEIRHRIEPEAAREYRRRAERAEEARQLEYRRHVERANKENGELEKVRDRQRIEREQARHRHAREVIERQRAEEQR